ncbi:MAG: hypothetical protein ABFS23_11500, partial [Pseudomonadota bacterium]
MSPDRWSSGPTQPGERPHKDVRAGARQNHNNRARDGNAKPDPAIEPQPTLRFFFGIAARALFNHRGIKREGTEFTEVFEIKSP